MTTARDGVDLGRSASTRGSPGVIQYKDKRGYATLRKIDAWGNITCVQERGFAGDANPPLWYIVPYC